MTATTPPAGRDARYSATLRYLGAVAHTESERHPAPPPVSLGPQFVRDVMVKGVVAAHEDAPFKEMVASLARDRISAVPVVDSDHRVIGVVSESDLLARVSGGKMLRPRGHHFSRGETRAKFHGATARELMTAPPVVTTPDTPIPAAAHLAAIRRVRRMPVVDANGRLVGIVTRSDLLRPFLRTDDDIRRQIIRNVIVGSLVLRPNQVHVDVVEGVVHLSGHVDRRMQMVTLLESARGVGGVVDVDGTALTYAVDDTISPAPAY